MHKRGGGGGGGDETEKLQKPTSVCATVSISDKEETYGGQPWESPREEEDGGERSRA